MRLPRIMVAAQSSGSGKTLATCGILQALVDRGLKVSSFKCGPDYIDPMFHSRVIGTRSRNLDAYFVDEETLRYLFSKTASGSDISVIEGVMGYYDGISVASSEASSCDVALKLGAPTALLVDAEGSSVSSLAVLKGFMDFGENTIGGVIFNRMSERVFSELKPLVEEMGVRPLGCIPRMDGLVLDSRHLGLVMPSEIPGIREKLSELARTVEETVDIDALMELARTAPDLEPAAPRVRRIDGDVRIGVASDEAFCFTYEDNLDLLRGCGAELVEFSPLRDGRLPDVDGIILSGGYPELHAEELSSNSSMTRDIRSKIEDGMPCIAECGGFMYLHERMEDPDGGMHEMCGTIRGEVRNSGRLSRFGYASFSSKEDGVMGGIDVRGHEFHYWDSDDCGEDWEATKTNGIRYGCMHDTGTLLAGFPHLYYYSNPESAARFVERCREYSERRLSRRRTAAGVASPINPPNIRESDERD